MKPKKLAHVWARVKGDPWKTCINCGDVSLDARPVREMNCAGFQLRLVKTARKES